MIEKLQEIAKNNKGKLLSDKYVTNKSKYLWECQKGHQWLATAGNVKQGSWCPIFPCFKKAKKNINILIDLATKNNGKCLSTEYCNRNTKYLWECEKGHQWRSNVNHILNDETWCPKCIKPGCIRDLEWLYNLAKENNGKCLSTEYKGRNRKYLWECEKGHQWSATLQNISRTAWCPNCRDSIGERLISKILILMEIDFIKEYPLQNCIYKRTLRGDFFLPKYNTLIEFDGIQHFKQSKGRWKKVSLSDNQIRDKIKNKFCKENNINLIRIPYTELKNIETILTEEFQNGFTRTLNMSDILLNSLI